MPFSPTVGGHHLGGPVLVVFLGLEAGPAIIGNTGRAGVNKLADASRDAGVDDILGSHDVDNAHPGVPVGFIAEVDEGGHMEDALGPGEDLGEQLGVGDVALDILDPGIRKPGRHDVYGLDHVEFALLQEASDEMGPKKPGCPCHHTNPGRASGLQLLWPLHQLGNLDLWRQPRKEEEEVKEDG